MNEQWERIKDIIQHSKMGRLPKDDRLMLNVMFWFARSGCEHILSYLDLSDSTILADKAYGINEILDYIQRQDGDYSIPPKSNMRNSWRCDWVFYKECHLIECFFLKLKQFSRLFRSALAAFLLCSGCGKDLHQDEDLQKK